MQPGQVLANHYKVIRKIAEGGMASIYLAVDTRTGNHLAIKCLYLHYEHNAIVRARFVDEGRIQMLLQHPNIVRVYELVQQPLLAFVMEYIEGNTLEEHLQERGPLPMQEITEVMIPVLSALGLAHSRGIIHRDLKPSNILVTHQGGALRPKVMDFGVAKLNRNQSLTATGTTVGTLHYMSPEQIVGAKNIDGRADIYSLGIILYKLTTGQVPFNASTEYSLMMAQVEAKPTPPSKLNPDIHPELEKIILKSLHKRAADRYPSIRDFTSALVALRDEDGNRTMESISVPSFILNYAINADVVAIDRTDQVMLESLTDENAIGLDTTPSRDTGADTAKDLPMIDTGAITNQRAEGNQRVSAAFEQQRIQDAVSGVAGESVAQDITLRQDEVSDDSTMEVDTSFLTDLRRRDAHRSDDSAEQDAGATVDLTPLKHPRDDDPTEQAPMSVASLNALLSGLPNVVHDDPEANKVTLQHKPLDSFADSHELTRPRPMLPKSSASSPGAPRSNAPPWTQRGPQPDFGVEETTPRAPTRTPSNTGPPKSVGPSYVDTRERTKPHISSEDVAISITPQMVDRARLDASTHSMDHLPAPSSSAFPDQRQHAEGNLSDRIKEKPRIWLIAVAMGLTVVVFMVVGILIKVIF